MILVSRSLGARRRRRQYIRKRVNEFRTNLEKPEEGFKFPIDLPQKKYSDICRATAKRYKGVLDVQVNGPRVTVFLERWSGATWSFYYEYRLDGKGILERPRVRSGIPEHFVATLTERIRQFREKYTKGWLIAECPYCKGKMLQEPESKRWECVSCGYELSNNEVLFIDNQETYQEQETNQKKSDSFFRKYIDRLIHQNDSNRVDHVTQAKNRDASVVPQNEQQGQNKSDRIINYCPHCGTYVESKAGKYCYNCGKKL